jgi:hypothetical protein
LDASELTALVVSITRDTTLPSASSTKWARLSTGPRTDPVTSAKGPVTVPTTSVTGAVTLVTISATGEVTVPIDSVTGVTASVAIFETGETTELVTRDTPVLNISLREEKEILKGLSPIIYSFKNPGALDTIDGVDLGVLNQLPLPPALVITGSVQRLLPSPLPSKALANLTVQ